MIEIIQILQFIGLYLATGFIWSKFIEYCVVGKVPGSVGMPFSTKDHVWQMTLWPLSVLIFIFHIIRNLFNGDY